MDRIKELLAQLAELDDTQLSQLESEILSEFETLESGELNAQAVEAMEYLANAVDAARTEQARRVAEREALSNKAAEAAQRIKRTDNSDPTTLPAPDAGAEPPASDPNTGPVAQEDPTTSPAVPAPNDGAPAGPGGEPIDPDEEARKRRKLEAVPGGAPAAASVATPEGAELSNTTPESQPDPTQDSETVAPQGDAAQSQPDATAEVQENTTSNSDAPVPDAADENQAGQQEPAQSQPVEQDQNTNAEGQPGSEASVQNTDTAQEAAVTAAANEPEAQLVIEPPADRRPTPKATAAVAITAGADIPGVSAGAKLKGMEDIADGFVKRLHGLRRVNGGDGEQHIVASLGFEYPEDRQLGNEIEENVTKIQNVVGRQALAASGGWCAPLEVRYDMPDALGTADRPVKDSLPSFNADRGGIRYMTPPLLGGYEAGISLWTAQNDINPTAPPVKPCVTVECGTEASAVVDAITLCLQFGNLMTRAYPELVKRHNEMALVQHARFAEISLVEQMELGSTKITATRQLGAMRDFLAQLDRAVAAYRNRHRLATVDTLRVIAPVWLKDLLRADIVMQMPGDGLDNTIGIADAQIDRWIAARGVRVTWHYDGPGWGTQGPGQLVDFPDTVEWFLFAEGTWLFLDGGTLDLGIIRDSGLVGTNDYKMFVETFEGLAKIGDESFHVTSDLSACGNAAALVETCAAVADATTP